MKSLFKTRSLAKTYNISGIYLIQIGNKMYVGSSVSIGRRLLTHKSRLKNAKHNNPIMINCFNKYGENHCNFKVLEECEENVLVEREKFYIDVLKPELNIELDPIKQNGSYKAKKVYQYDLDGTFIQEHESASSAERSLNRSNTKVSQCAMGKRKSAYDYLWSYNKVDKLVYENNSSKAKAKKVSQYTMEGELIITHDSVAAAVRSLNLQENAATNISSAALGNTNHAYNYVWKYE
jgi:group I intron endonuclease